MKYSCSVELDVPREDAVNKFDNEENLYHWMRGLQSIEHISGEKGEIGSQSKVRFKMGKREIEMTETITEKNLPETFTATYNTVGVYNIVSTRFKKISDSKTVCTTDNEFQFKSLGMKFFSWIMPSAFKKQSMVYLTDFKNFVENGASVAKN